MVLLRQLRGVVQRVPHHWVEMGGIGGGATAARRWLRWSGGGWRERPLLEREREVLERERENEISS